MVFELARREIRAEAASRTRRNTLCAQNATQQQREMAAHAAEFISGLARNRQRLRVVRANSRHHFPNRTQMRVVAMLFGKRETVQEGRYVAMNQHTLHDFAQRPDVPGQRL